MRNLIRDSKIPQIHSIIQVNSKIGMKSMKDSVYDLLKEELITNDEAKRVLNIDRGAVDDENPENRNEKRGF